MKEVLIIDHWDSFTYNLVQLVEQCGAKVKVIEYGPNAFSLVREYKFVILSPGPGVVDEYPLSLDFLKRNERTNILGVCLGMQLIAKVFGATLSNQKKIKHGQNAMVVLDAKIEETSILWNIENPFQVALYHSWAVNESSVKSPLIITCRSIDNIIMGLKHTNFPMEGVQFHPESFLCTVGGVIIKNWLKVS